MLEALFKYQFLQNAVAAAFFASVACGIIGIIVIEKKLVMMSGGIAHTAYGGVGLSFLLGVSPMLGAFSFAVAAAFGIGYINRKGGARSDVVIGLFWSFGMALGILFIALTPGYPPNLTTYLFGNILSVTLQDLYLIITVTLVVTAAVAVFFNHWKAYLFDDEFCAVLGIKTVVMEYALLNIVAVTVVALIRVVGIILVLALLCAPAASAGLLTSRLKSRMIAAVLFGLFFCFAGLWLSYSFNIASGAAIVIFSVLCYIIIYTVRTAVFAAGKKRTLHSGEVK